MKTLIAILFLASLPAMPADQWGRFALDTGEFQRTEMNPPDLCQGWLPLSVAPRPVYNPATHKAILGLPRYTGTNFVQKWVILPLNPADRLALQCQTNREALYHTATNILFRLEDGQDLDRDQMRDVLRFILMRVLQARGSE
jgi:hypothetical protein